MSPHEERWLLACFDLDGTLVRGTSTCRHLSRYIGHEQLLASLEDRYARGEASNAEVAEQDARHYAGLGIGQVRDMLSDIPLIDGIDVAVAKLKARGIPSIICTVTWKFAAEVIATRFGFAEASGCEMALAEGGLLTGEVSRHFDEYSKVDFVRQYCRIHHIPIERAFAVGDSRSDIPLFGAVGFSIALNASAGAKKAAACSLETSWLQPTRPRRARRRPIATPFS